MKVLLLSMEKVQVFGIPTLTNIQVRSFSLKIFSLKDIRKINLHCFWKIVERIADRSNGDIAADSYHRYKVSATTRLNTSSLVFRHSNSKIIYLGVSPRTKFNISYLFFIM